MQKSYLKSVTGSCLSRLLLSLGIAVVVLAGFAFIGLVAAALPVRDEIRAVVLTIGSVGFIFLVVAVLIGAGFVLARRRADVMDAAFRSFNLEGSRYMLMGRQYAGTDRGREVNVYFHISGGSYSRIPVLQFYAAGDIPTRVGVGTHNMLASLASGLLKRTPMPVDDPAFAELEVYPQEEPWARGLFSDARVREDIAALLTGDIPGNLRGLIIGPGAVSLTLRYFNPNHLDPEVLRRILNRLIAIAEAAERQPQPAVRVEENSFTRASRTDRRSIALLLLVLLGLLFLCPLILGGLSFLVLMTTGN